MKPPKCVLCGPQSEVKLRRIVNAASVSMFAWYCLHCKSWVETPVRYFKHDVILPALAKQGAQADDIPIVADYRLQCQICGHVGAEYHHWLPQMFKEHPDITQQWPTWEQQGINLCKYHHDLWHDLVTPWMPGRGNSRKTAT